MNYALHETLEVHEMAAFKTICLTKSKAMQSFVSDPALKALMEEDVTSGLRHLQELKAILAKADPQEMTK